MKTLMLSMHYVWLTRVSLFAEFAHSFHEQISYFKSKQAKINSRQEIIAKNKAPVF
jgi:hypothetical protein